MSGKPPKGACGQHGKEKDLAQRARSSQGGQGSEEEKVCRRGAESAKKMAALRQGRGGSLKFAGGAEQRVTQDTLRGDAGHCNAEKVEGKSASKRGTE
jgi:hypothetical protein